MNIMLVMTKREEPCIGFLKMLSQNPFTAEEPNHTLHKCPYNGRLIQKLWNEQQKKKINKKIHPDVAAATQRQKDNLLASMPGDYIMSTSV